MKRQYVYIRSEPTLWTVGFYRPDDTFQPESDHESPDLAAKRVAWLNGGSDPELLEALKHATIWSQCICRKDHGDTPECPQLVAQQAIAKAKARAP